MWAAAAAAAAPVGPGGSVGGALGVLAAGTGMWCPEDGEEGAGLLRLDVPGMPLPISSLVCFVCEWRVC